MKKEVDIKALLASEAAKAGSQRALAKRLGVSAVYLGDVIAGRRDAGEKILKPLGLRRVVRIEKIVTYEK